MLDYLRPDSSLTLRDAIGQLRKEDAKKRDVAPIAAPEMQRAITAHDAVHVIFACDTSDRGEAVAHAWMLLGTTVTRRALREVMRSRDHRSLAAEVGHRRRLSALLSALPAVGKAALRARRMHRRWPWDGYDRYLDVSLADIRREYGIRVPEPERP